MWKGVRESSKGSNKKDEMKNIMNIVERASNWDGEWEIEWLKKLIVLYWSVLKYFDYP